MMGATADMSAVGEARSLIERAADRSAAEHLDRARAKRLEQARAIVWAARRLVTSTGSAFTTQDLVKEAGIALKTFYRYFASKDELILAVIEDMVNEAAGASAEQGALIDDPLERLYFYTTSVTSGLRSEDDHRAAQFMAIEHWRLLAWYPVEVIRASQSYTALLHEAIEACMEAGVIETSDPLAAAELVTHLVRSIFMHQAFLGPSERKLITPDRLWEFCLRGLNVHTGQQP